MRKFILLCLVVSGLILTVSFETIARSEEKEFSTNFNMPVLLVSKGEGRCEKISIKISRTKTDAPLRVSISDDTPTGSGPAIRASTWIAAMTAAMYRNDTMNGVRIEIDFSGFVDGPSAGGMMCLSILSALDGRKIPSDFAMTGTIMPDGTIDLVGGVALKMRGAAKAGIKKMCIPSFLRIEKQNDGNDIDLVREAENLGMKLILVDNIETAYAAMHDLPIKTASTISEKEICAFPKESEDFFKTKYKEFKKSRDEKWQRIPKDDQSAIMASPDFIDLFDSRSAVKAFEAGQMAYALDKISLSDAMLAAREKNVDFVESLYQKYPALAKKIGMFNKISYRKSILALIDMNDRDFKNSFLLNQANIYSPDVSEMKNISAQLINVEMNTEFIGAYVYSRKHLEDFENNVKDADKDKLKAIFNTLIYQRLMLLLFPIWAEINGKLRQELSTTIPQIASTRAVYDTENMFYCAWVATDNSIETDVITPKAQQYELDPKKLREYFNCKDMQWDMYHYSSRKAKQMHNAIPANSDYHATASMHMQINMLVRACALFVKWNILDTNNTSENKLKYSNSVVLAYLIRTARSQALNNIALCKERKIPCISPLIDFESAEMDRDDADFDKVDDVLVKYWLASLNAKALVMAFGND